MLKLFIRSLGMMVCLCLLMIPTLALAQPDAKLLWELDLERGLGGLTEKPVPRPQATVSNEKDHIRVAGKGENCSAQLHCIFQTVPFPTQVRMKLTMQSDARVMFYAEDAVSGAFVCLAQMNPAQLAWSFSSNGKWDDWKGYQSVKKHDDKTTLELIIMQFSPGKFRLSTSDTKWTREIANPQLTQINRLRIAVVGTDPRVLIHNVQALYVPTDESKPNAAVVEHPITLLPKVQINPENPLANGYQIPFFERGFSDAMTDSVLRAELIATMHRLGVGSVRFPGGTWSYYYFGNTTNAFPATKRFAERPDVKPFYWTYWLNNHEHYRDVDDDQFFTFARELAVPVLYQLNMAYWYDPTSDQVVLLAPLNSRRAQGKKIAPIAPQPQYMADALKAARNRVRQTKQMGLDVTWELGNEDYTNFNPQTYYQQCKAFVTAIREVDPQARFIFCGDSHSWSDWQWQVELQAILQANGFTDLTDAAVHVYFSGGGGGPRENGQQMYEVTRYAYSQLQFMHPRGSRKRLDDHGMRQVGISLTETNTIFIKGITGKPLEHSMGRALGEASVWVDLIRNYKHVVHHDLVRNGYGDGTWFARLAYRPYNEQGKRYDLFLDGKIMATMHRHARNHILITDENITVSQDAGNLLVSVGNPLAIPRTDRFEIQGTVSEGFSTSWHILSSDSLDMPYATAGEQTIKCIPTEAGIVLEVITPPFAFGWSKVPTP